MRPEDLSPETLAVRGGLRRTEFDETSEALFLTSGYVYSSAEEAESAFAGDIDRFIYSRYGNPTVETFQDRISLIEGAEGAWATASGMAAVFVSLIASLESGDRVVAARGLFGSCFIILSELLPRWGIETEFVEGADLTAWEKALSEPTKVVFFETPSNPMQGLIDIEAVSEMAHAVGARVIVDNVFATPILQRPMEFGADVVVYSTTKHFDGQGRTLGGAVLGKQEFLEQDVKPFMRHTGPSMSPFNAWILTKSLETLSMRVEHMSKRAKELAGWLSEHPRVRRVIYPHHPSHPQFDLAKRQMTAGGTVVTFELDGAQAECFSFLNALELIDISNNLGDSKTLMTHPATTTHRRLGPDVRADMGITDAVVRLSVGLEGLDDLKTDLSRGLSAV